MRLLNSACCLLVAWLLASSGELLSAQTGVERERWREIARQVGHIMERGDRTERIAKVEELVAEGHPFCARLIARGIAVSHQRSQRMDRRVSDALARNAELYSRLKIQPPQQKGDRTKNDEINANLDLVDRLQELGAEERAFRREAVARIRKLVDSMSGDNREILAQDVLGELGGAKGEYKMALLDVAARIPLPQTLDAAILVAQSDRDQVLRLTAIDALGESGEERAAEGLVAVLRDPRWQLRVAAVEALRKLRKKAAIPALIEAMGREEGRVREDILAALQDMTGVDKSDNPAVWRNWWEENKDKPLAAQAARPAPRPGHPAAARHPQGGGRAAGGGWADRQGGAGATSFYGIETKSKHIVYILDHSGSMQLPASAGDRTGGEGTAGLIKIEVAKNELWKSIQSLPADATFNILFYNHAYTVFRDRMIGASPANKQAAKEYIDGIVADNRTNIYDTLQRAFEIGGQGAVDKEYKVNFDTIFFLTDGSPTSGKTTDWREILAEVERWNKAKRIKVHCVGIGPHNSAFLHGLAAQTGGEYTTRG